MRDIDKQLRSIATEFGRTFDDVHELWLERAGLREFEAGQERNSANHDAIADVREWFTACSQRSQSSLGARP